MYKENELNYLYDLFFADDQSLFPQGPLGDDRQSKRNAITIIRYAVEDYLHWTADTFRACISLDVIKNLKLTQIARHIADPTKPSFIPHLIAEVYPLPAAQTLRSEIIDIYDSIINRERERYPHNFFEGESGKNRAIVCLQTAINRYMLDNPMTQAQLYRLFAIKGTDLITKWKLSSVISTHIFESPLDYVHESIPKRRRSDALYRYYRLCSVSDAIEDPLSFKRISADV